MHRQDIRVTDPKEQQHFHRPASDPPDHGEPLDHLVLLHPAELIDLGDLATGGMGGEVLDGASLCLRETDAPQFRMPGPQNRLRVERLILGVERAESLKNRFGGFAGQLLVHDAVGQ
jgi:hypothetical protein